MALKPVNDPALLAELNGTAPAGLRSPGNIDLHNRPRVQNPDGSYSTVKTIGIGTDAGEVVIPTISDDGRTMSEREAIDQYRKTGKSFGVFDTPANATAFAQSLHEQQAQEYGGRRPVSDPAVLEQLNGTPRGLGQSAPSPLMAPVGGAEMLLKFGTGGLASIPAGLAYGGAAIGKAFGADVDPAQVQSKVQDYLTYRPQSASGQAAEQTLRGLAQPLLQPVADVADRAASAVGQVSPFAETMMREAPHALQAVGGVLPAAAGARAAMTAPFKPSAPEPVKVAPAGPTAEEILSRMDSPQSMGAAAASPNLTGVSPELKQAVVKTARKTGGAVNPDVFARQMEADTLPVRMKLTEGMATQDPMIISHEMNLRGKSQKMVDRYNELNRQLAQNAQAIRDEAGPDVFTTNHVEHADTLISAYKAKHDAAQTEIGKLYQQLRDANGGQFPVDAKALLDGASAQLHHALLIDHAPPAVMKTLTRLSEKGAMTFENFEALRTNLARIQRSPSADGNEKAAARIIRDAMEQLPLSRGAAAVKPLADAARAAARTEFQALEADPAYAAAVMETIPPDRFVARYIINAPRDDIARMRANFADNDSALQTMGVAALDHLRDAARLNPHYEGNFASASFNKALQGLSPKLAALLPPKTAEHLEKLGNVARYTTAQPKGSFVNNSNTFVAGAADYGAGAAEGMVNFAAGGIPVGTWGRRALQNIRQEKDVEKALAPGAGLGQLNRPQQ
jgi:hypothetical protein